MVPDRVMDRLEMPFALTGLQVDAHQRFRKQVVARTMSAVEIGGGRFDRQIDQAEFFVDRDLRPYTSISVNVSGPVLPRVVTELAFLRDRVERPEQLSGAQVEGADKTLRGVAG